MNNLPNDLLIKILNHLNIMERVKLRLVSTRFRNIYNKNYEINDLVVSSNLNGLDNRWWKCWELINYRENLVWFLDLSYPTSLLNNLRRLKIKNDLKFNEFKRIGRFRLLNHLEINGTLELDELVDEFESIIDLPNLRILYIRNVERKYENSNRILFNSTLLESVYFGGNSINCISTIDTTSVKYLEFHLDHYNNQDSLFYVNAEIIKCNQALDMSIEVLTHFVTFDRLKELHLNIEELYGLSDFPKFGNFQYEFALNRLAQTCNALLNQNDYRQSTIDSMIDIYIQGVDITKQNQFQTVLFFDKLIKLHYIYHHFVPMRLHSVKAIDYQDLIDTVQMFPPLMMIKRYPNVQKINMVDNRCINDRSFILFLGYFQNLSFLSLQFTEFPQDFYEKLPKVSSLINSLNHLVILDKGKLNFDFVHKFEFLHNLVTNLCTTDMALKMIKGLNGRGTYEFQYDRMNTIVLRKIKNNQYNLTIKENIRCIDQYELDQSSHLRPSYEQLADIDNILEYYFMNLTFVQLKQKLDRNKELLKHSFDHRTH